MSNLGGGEIFVVLLLALIVLGPDRLPEAARKIGGFVRQIRQMSSGFQQEVRRAMDYTDGDKPFHPEEAHIRPLPAPTSVTDDVTAGEDAPFETDVRGVGAEPFTTAAGTGDDTEHPDGQRATG